MILAERTENGMDLIGLTSLYNDYNTINACDKIISEKVAHKNVNNEAKTKFSFDENNGNFGKMMETEIIK